jgi:protein-tyrosine phosphatase
MIDIHCHILPGVDDGPVDLETSIRMLKTAAADGITGVVASPHFRFNGGPSSEDIHRGLAVLKEKAVEEGIPLKLYAGADIRLSPRLVEKAGRKDIPTINGSRYFLLELPDVIPPNIDRFLFDVRAKGFSPIITHPERNHGLLSRPEKIGLLRDGGAIFQVTAMSITGEFGQQIRMYSLMLLKKKFIDFVASDAHDPVVRKPVLSAAKREAARIVGEREAERIFLQNPLSVLENRPLP